MQGTLHKNISHAIALLTILKHPLHGHDVDITLSEVPWTSGMFKDVNNSSLRLHRGSSSMFKILSLRASSLFRPLSTLWTVDMKECRSVTRLCPKSIWIIIPTRWQLHMRWFWLTRCIVDLLQLTASWFRSLRAYDWSYRGQQQEMKCPERFIYFFFTALIFICSFPIKIPCA